MSSRRVNIKSLGRGQRLASAQKVSPKIDEFEVVIRDLASDGRGVGEAPDGQVVFVAGAWRKERVHVRRTRQGANTSTELINIIEACEERIEPICEYHNQNQCGGCPWMFVSYEAQLSAKVAKLRASLDALGSAHIDVVVHPSAQRLGYRNRAQLKTNGKVLGYLGASSHEIVDVGACPILTEKNQAQLRQMRLALPNNAWRPKSRQKWVTLDIDDQRAEPLINKRQSFRQANDDQNVILSQWLRRMLRLPAPSGGLVELFCGSGNLTAVLSECYPDHQITAVEGDELALEQLSFLGLQNVTPHRSNLFSAVDIEALIAGLPDSNGVVLDPPRDGLKERGALAPLFSTSPWVVYISCNLATWQRDARFLQGLGLTLTQVEGLDMFPQTPHLEVLSVFERC